MKGRSETVGSIFQRPQHKENAYLNMRERRTRKWSSDGMPEFRLGDGQMLFLKLCVASVGCY